MAISVAIDFILGTGMTTHGPTAPNSNSIRVPILLCTRGISEGVGRINGCPCLIRTWLSKGDWADRA